MKVNRTARVVFPRQTWDFSVCLSNRIRSMVVLIKRTEIFVVMCLTRIYICVFF